MDCAALCLLTVAVGFKSAPGTTGCNYCVEARSTYQDCFDDVIECAYRDPKSLIFCLNIYENTKDNLIQHTLRCINYAEFYVGDADIKGITANGVCKYRDVQDCDCTTCSMPKPPENITTVAPVARTTRKSIIPKVLTSSAPKSTANGPHLAKNGTLAHRYRSVQENPQHYIATPSMNNSFSLSPNIILHIVTFCFLNILLV